MQLPYIHLGPRLRWFELHPSLRDEYVAWTRRLLLSNEIFSYRQQHQDGNVTQRRARHLVITFGSTKPSTHPQDGNRVRPTSEKPWHLGAAVWPRKFHWILSPESFKTYAFIELKITNKGVFCTLNSIREHQLTGATALLSRRIQHGHLNKCLSYIVSVTLSRKLPTSHVPHWGRVEKHFLPRCIVSTTDSVNHKQTLHLTKNVFVFRDSLSFRSALRSNDSTVSSRK